MALNGSLDDYSPAGALRVLSSTGKTGAVRFSGDAGCTVYLHKGQLYFARDERTDEALAAALVRPGRLSAEQWSAAIDEAADQPRVGELLVERSAINDDLLASVVLSVVYDPLIRLFREADGQFEFEPDTVHWIGPFRSFNVDAIVAEVRRRVREADEMSPVIPSVDAWVTVERVLPGDAVQVTLLREDWELVAACQGPRTIAELAHDLGRGQYSTARVVYRLAKAGLVHVEPETLSSVNDDGTRSERSTAKADADAFGGAIDIADLDRTAAHSPVGDWAGENTPMPTSAAFETDDAPLGLADLYANDGTVEGARFDPSSFDNRSFDDAPSGDTGDWAGADAEGALPPFEPIEDVDAWGTPPGQHADADPWGAPPAVTPDPWGTPPGQPVPVDADPWGAPPSAAPDPWGAPPGQPAPVDADPWAAPVDPSAPVDPWGPATEQPAFDDTFARDNTFEGDLNDAEFEETFQRAFGGTDFGSSLEGFDHNAPGEPNDLFSRDPFAPALPQRHPGDDPLLSGNLPHRQAGAVATDTGMAGFGAPEVDDDRNPNAVWLESLYAQFIDEPENTTKKRKKEAIEIAFDAEELDQEAKVGTLRRLLGAIKKL
jgi:hypothetical protein